MRANWAFLKCYFFRTELHEGLARMHMAQEMDRIGVKVSKLCLDIQFSSVKYIWILWGILISFSCSVTCIQCSKPFCLFQDDCGENSYLVEHFSYFTALFFCEIVIATFRETFGKCVNRFSCLPLNVFGNEKKRQFAVPILKLRKKAICTDLLISREN